MICHDVIELTLQPLQVQINVIPMEKVVDFGGQNSLVTFQSLQIKYLLKAVNLNRIIEITSKRTIDETTPSQLSFIIALQNDWNRRKLHWIV